MLAVKSRILFGGSGAGMKGPSARMRLSEPHSVSRLEIESNLRPQATHDLDGADIRRARARDIDAERRNRNEVPQMRRFVLISGCSGGGKSTLLAELRRRGYAIVEEPGRRIVQEELQRDGSALPWRNETAFLRRVFELALTDRAQASRRAGWVFFDRGLIDAAAGLERAAGESTLTMLGQSHRYHRRVFLAPPWPEIHVIDRERRHGLDTAVAEYRHLLEVYPALG
jgi:predicted ATPase